MKTMLLRGALTLICGLFLRVAAAQSVWQQVYGGPSRETSTQAVQLKAGGYLLVGTRAQQNEKYEELYLIRTDELGATRWTSTQLIGNGGQVSPAAACENGAGQVLVAANISTGSAAQGNLAVVGWLGLLEPDGRLVWSKRTAALSSGAAKVFAGIILDDAGSFWVATNEAAGSAVLGLNAAGQETQRVPVAAGPIYNLFRLPTGVLVHTAGRLTELSAQGTLGRETPLPLQVFPSAQNTTLTDVVALDNDDVLLVSNGQLDKIKLHSSVVYWTQSSASSSPRFFPFWAKRLPDGSLLVFGQEYVFSHSLQPTLVRLSAEGTQLYGPPASPGGNPVPIRLAAGSSISAGCAGLFIDPATSQAVVGGFLRGIEASEQEIFLRAYSLTNLGVVTSAAQPRASFQSAWPNPLTDEDLLTLPQTATQEARQFQLYNGQGQLVRTWPSPTSRLSPQLSLRGVPAGVYVLVGQGSGGEVARFRLVKH